MTELLVFSASIPTQEFEAGIGKSFGKGKKY